MAKTSPTSNRRIHWPRDNNRNDRAGARIGQRVLPEETRRNAW